MAYPSHDYLLKVASIVYRKYVAIEIERGKRLLITPLITGFQKIQLTAISPFRQMLSAFDRDCLETGVLYIIGYSFGDERINDIIRNTSKYNSSMKIVIVDPVFNDLNLMINFISNWRKINTTEPRSKISDHNPFHSYNVFPVTKTISEFLSENPGMRA